MRFEVGTLLEQKKAEVAVFTTVFPGVVPYFSDLLKSLEEQTYSAFDVILLNDGIEDLDKIVKDYSKLNILKYDVHFSISKNRELGLRLIQKMEYEIVIFIDSDDYMSNNRVEVSIDHLKSNDILVNDVHLFDEKGIILNDYFSNRLPNNQSITEGFILDKNIFGLSNTAMKVSLINDIEFDNDLKVVDWYLYHRLLHNGARAIFTNLAHTYYRQYDHNMTSLDRTDRSYLLDVISVKKNHYKLMSLLDDNYRNLLVQLELLENNIRENHYSIEIESIKNKNLLWWEITNYITI